MLRKLIALGVMALGVVVLLPTGAADGDNDRFCPPREAGVQFETRGRLPLLFRFDEQL